MAHATETSQKVSVHWLTFICEPRDPSKKTDTWLVENTNTRINLGSIKWFGNFRKYGYAPSCGKIFDAQCLRDIADFCELLTAKHKGKVT